MAESEGFGPPEGYEPSTVFKTASIDHSDNSPLNSPIEISSKSLCVTFFFHRNHIDLILKFRCIYINLLLCICPHDIFTIIVV